MGFFQVLLDPKDAEKTAFVVPNGHYQMKVMSMGLCNSPATFQRLTDKLLVNLNWKQCIVYMDDIIIFAKDFDQHILRLSNVLERLQSANLKCKLEKCKFAVDEIKYLGFYLTKDGLRMDESKVEAILKMPIPKSSKQVRMFIGAVNHHKLFIKNLGKIAAPLYALQSKKQKFEWTAKCQSAFDLIKQKLTAAPLLIMPNPNKVFHIITDASGQALGAELAQFADDNQLHPIAYGNRHLVNLN
jgi:hypothetical protein